MAETAKTVELRAVAQAIAEALPESVDIVATDLNQPMLDLAASIGTVRPIQWRQADAMQLPFSDASFDVVVCQFGAMFFPDKVQGYKEARRVLKPGGYFLFSVWDKIEENDFADVISQALAKVFPDDPPRFMARTPHGYHDEKQIRQELKAAGFTNVSIDAVDARSKAPSPHVAAVAYCQGTPWKNEIEARGAPGLEEATNQAADALALRFGTGAVDGRIRALVISSS